MTSVLESTPMRPPGTFSPEAIELPKPKFMATSAVPSEGSLNGDAVQAQHTALKERLMHLKEEQRQSFLRYLDLAKQLTDLRSSPRKPAVQSILSTPAPVVAPAQVALTPTPFSNDVVTIKVCGLPLHCTQDMFLSELLAHGFQRSFDFLYIPFIHGRGNLGWAIVNFKQPQYAMRFLQVMHAQGFTANPAEMQGYDANYEEYTGYWVGQLPLSRKKLCPEM